MKAKYAWVINYCRDEDEKRYEGILVGPRNIAKSLIDNGVNPQRFRMYTDDYKTDLDNDEPSVHVYEGVIYGEDAEGFEPLDDYGMPNYGCCYIAYWQDEPPSNPRFIMEESDGGYWVEL
jgi:hypothetical protein